jgi:4-hydroxy-tetrahydrodipicolinate reductase
MATRLKVAVVGSAGRMGHTTCDAITACDDLELVARIDRGDDLGDAVDAGAQVLVDFTTPDAVMGTLARAVGDGLNVVVGTSGFDEARLRDVAQLCGEHPEVGVVVAPNFALGAVLLMRFAREAAAHFESVEVVELHHPDKVDAPSGTAVHTARAIAGARRAAGAGAVPDATATGLTGARGADVDGVTVHSVRLRGLVAHEEVLFGNPGEVLTLRHDSLDRVSFMPGVLLAVRAVVHRPGLTVGLEPLLGLDPAAP